jgi:hypothetical protein
VELANGTIENVVSNGIKQLQLYSEFVDTVAVWLETGKLNIVLLLLLDALNTC